MVTKKKKNSYDKANLKSLKCSKSTHAKAKLFAVKNEMDLIALADKALLEYIAKAK